MRGGPQQLRPPSNLREDLWPQEDDPNIVPEEALLMPLLVQLFEWTPSAAVSATAGGGKASTSSGGGAGTASSYGYGGGIWPECEVRCAVGCLGLAATASPADAAAALGVQGLDRLLQLAELKVNLPGRSGRVREVAVTTISVLTPVVNNSNKSGDGGGGAVASGGGAASSGGGGNNKNTVHLTPEDLAEETAELAEELQLAAVSARHAADEAIGAGLPGAEGLVVLANQADEVAQAAEVKAQRAAKALATWQVIEANFILSFRFLFPFSNISEN